ncbi:uncharacterized protein Z519_01335 [Cladophialophora bantiana CBS 173.52]|uniref:Major facilitator superfamily (MFS) profile domain-containing protein n=1 Tax=Cladophialophora bantiana (strain ATCC 10958 / CBS 173.52 / CDC B-1940 / NIH 8579) TaxID=1442370 RepID=A0A0D2F6C9_CLAB1|nr:uncharacterized protein Z519_01335 [Cladophialophora bantiana CBS 173.52]KIW97751.1 hypothetical protein Z519_01335 [Cladophialophora bantiana CBS 173.52]
MTKVETLSETVEHGPGLVAREKFYLYNYFIVAIIAIGATASGMMTGVMSTALGQPTFLEYFHFNTASSQDTALIGAINGVYFGGAFFGSFNASYVADRWGRKTALMVTAFVATVCSGLIAGSVHIAMLLVFRTIAGWTSGAYITICCLSLSELAPPHHRGLMVALVGILNCLGYVISNWLGVAFYFVPAGGVQWRIPFALCCVPSLIVFGSAFFVPESPRWLVMKDRHLEAAAILNKLHCRLGDEQSQDFVRLELQQIKRQIEFERNNEISWWQMLTAKHYRRRLVLCIMTMLMAQSAGNVVIVVYGPVIYESLGFGPVAQLCLTSGYATSGMVDNFIGSFFIDKIGRVRMMIIGIVAQLVLLAIATGLIAAYAGTTNFPAQRAVVAIFWLFMLSYGALVEGAAFTYISEIWPAHLRARGSAIGIATLYLIDMVYVEASLYAFSTIGWKFYLTFLACGTVFLFIFILLAKETKGKPLEEIGKLFGDDLIVKTQDEMIKAEKEVFECENL